MKKKVLLFSNIFVVAFLGCHADDFDVFLRYYIMPLAAAAYSDAPSICLKSIETECNLQLYNQYTFYCDSLDDTCSGYIAIDSFNQYIIIAFRGTSRFLQLVVEGWDDNEFKSFLGGNVSEYFYNGFTDIWGHGMKDDFYTLKNKYPCHKIVVTGHSLGGAMASIAAATIVSITGIPSSMIYLYTFGQPRTGKSNYANAFNALGLAATYRVVHNRDMVAHLPKKDAYDYYHHVQEIWYQNDMAVGDSYFFCDPTDGEDPKCSDSLSITLSIDDHKHYFGHEVSDFGTNGCPNDGTKIALKQNQTKTSSSRPYRLHPKQILGKKLFNLSK